MVLWGLILGSFELNNCGTQSHRQGFRLIADWAPQLRGWATCIDTWNAKPDSQTAKPNHCAQGMPFCVNFCARLRRFTAFSSGGSREHPGGQSQKCEAQRKFFALETKLRNLVLNHRSLNRFLRIRVGLHDFSINLRSLVNPKKNCFVLSVFSYVLIDFGSDFTKKRENING